MRELRRFFALFLFCVLLSSTSFSSYAMDELTLYATWQVAVTFDANGGILTGGATDAERALAGKSSGSITTFTTTSASTGLQAQKDLHAFLYWNTRADGSGVNIEDYGQITGPVTFYAVYYKTDFTYVGHEETFIAPYDGWYLTSCWGAMGGQDTASQGEYLNKYGGSGAYTTGKIYLNKGDSLYLHVGGRGVEGNAGLYAGYNGGGAAPAVGSSGSGGGATDIRTVSGAWNQNLTSRIMVAAGGGGGGAGGPRYAGDGGALVSASVRGTGNVAYAVVGGASQTSAGPYGGFGYGGSSPGAGAGGGGGWYGGGCHGSADTSGSGGVSYISGYEGCAASVTGVSFMDTGMISGSDEMPAPGGGLETGHYDSGYARIVLFERA